MHGTTYFCFIICVSIPHSLKYSKALNQFSNSLAVATLHLCYTTTHLSVRVFTCAENPLTTTGVIGVSETLLNTPRVGLELESLFRQETKGVPLTIFRFRFFRMRSYGVTIFKFYDMVRIYVFGIIMRI